MKSFALAVCGLVILSAPLSVASQAAEIRGIGNKCLDVQGGRSDDLTPIILYHCNGGANQQWTVANGEIRGIGNKCLDVKGGGAEDLTPIILYHCAGGANQRWAVVNGEIRGIGNKCLDVKGARPDDLTPIILYRCKGAPDNSNQRWVVR
jgi:uncharacterized protein YuzB (UPF0349 family)